MSKKDQNVQVSDTTGADKNYKSRSQKNYLPKSFLSGLSHKLHNL